MGFSEKTETVEEGKIKVEFLESLSPIQLEAEAKKEFAIAKPRIESVIQGEYDPANPPILDHFKYFLWCTTIGHIDKNDPSQEELTERAYELRNELRSRWAIEDASKNKWVYEHTSRGLLWNNIGKRDIPYNILDSEDGTPHQTSIVLLQGGAGSGKLLLGDCNILTPYGYKKMEDIEVGDRICSAYGEDTDVIWKSEKQYVPMYRITFNDGRQVQACEHHQWECCTDNKIYKGGERWRISTTKQLLDMMVSKKDNKRKKNIYIPIADPVFFMKREYLSIPPYILGALLGDGSISDNGVCRIHTEDDEMIQHIKECGMYLDHTAHTENRITPIHHIKLMDCAESIFKLNLTGHIHYNAFIPDVYKFTSKEDRWELMRGLLDTGGYCDENGHIEYVALSKQLALDVQWIARSLGGHCTLTEKTPQHTHKGEKKSGQLGYRLYILFKETDAKPFKLTQKLERYKLYKEDSSELVLGIESIEYIGMDYGYCISVAHRSSLYLVEDFIVTHNSKSLCQRLAYLFMTEKNKTFLVARSTMPSLVKSVYLDPKVSIFAQLAEWNLPVAKWLNKSERTIRHPSNGNIIYFIGLDDPHKIKSMNINYAWLEEATELSEEKFRQVLLRTRAATVEEPNMIYLSYNPVSTHNWVLQKFILKPTSDIIRDSVVNYSVMGQNPFLPLSYLKNAYTQAAQSKEFYQVYIIGKPGAPVGQIYSNFEYQSYRDWPKEVWNEDPFYGVDFGFNDPQAVVECRKIKTYDHVTEAHIDTIYVNPIYYRRGENTEDLKKFLIDHKIPTHARLYCDTSRPESIETLMRTNAYGPSFHALPATKKILDGISYIQGIKIVVDSSAECIKEFEEEAAGYTWEVDSDNSDILLDKPIDKNNHFLDALRYACFTEHLRGLKIGAGAVNLNTDRLPVLSEEEIKKNPFALAAEVLRKTDFVADIGQNRLNGFGTNWL